MSFIFLKAQWNNLIMANYTIDPVLLNRYLPKYTELDFYNQKAYVSLVGFMFNDTKILGVKIPFHINFEEVNLRFYVRYNEKGSWKRGVVFIKEIVPRYAITYIANNFYHEKYVTMKMAHSTERTDNELAVAYSWKHNSRWYKIGVTTTQIPRPMVTGSEEEFIAQHYYGYSKYDSNTTFEYEVQHPSWKVYPVKTFDIDCNFSSLYGDEFAFLQHTVPSSVFLADGSDVIILQKRKLTLSTSK